MKKTGQRKAKLIGIEELERTNENTQITSHTGRAQVVDFGSVQVTVEKKKK